MKQAIVVTYFAAWKNVLKTWHNRPNLGYVDLYSGPGIYSHGSPSAPLLILNQALEDDYLVDKLIAVFNDGDPQLAAQLKINIEQLPGIQRLRIKPGVCNCPVSDTAIRLRPAGPSLLFAGPWGYKGLSITLIARFLETPGSDCIFFFNYNRINAGLGWKGFDEPLGQVFGQGRAEALRSGIRSLKRTERERVIIGEMQAALKGVGARCALPFRFVSADLNRTSRHLLFASKHLLGCQIMKNVMRDHSSTIMQGLGSFEFAGAVSQSEQLILPGLGPLDELKADLTWRFIGQTMTVDELIVRNGHPTAVERNYKDAILQLEGEGVVTVAVPGRERRHYKGGWTLPDDSTITFVQTGGGN